VVFYGIPEFYPRFGCVPVLPALRTELRAGAGAGGGGGRGAAEPLEDAVEGDLPAVARLYRELVAVRPCSVGRPEEA